MRFDIRLALRRFIRRPASTLLMALTLSLGVGASTAVFSIVDQLLLRPAPFAHAERLVDVLDIDRKTGSGGNVLTPSKILGWQQQAAVFEAFEVYAPRQFDLSGTETPERLDGLIVSTGLLPMLGAQPRLGRGFVDDDGRPGADRVVLISESLWRSRFGGRGDVLGARIALNDEDYTIVGVMPRRFRLQGQKEAVWIPYNVRANETDVSVRGFYGLARIARGVDRSQVQPLVDSVGERMDKETPIPRTWALRVTPKKVARVDETTRTALLVLLGAVGFVLLITCANVANLFLAHAAARQREMTVRSAIGAGRLRLIREVLTESVLLALCGGAAGMLLATWGVSALVAAAPPNLAFQATSPVEVDARVLIVAAVVTLLTGLFFGIVPALRGSRLNLESTLRGAGSGSTARSAYGRLPGALVVAEVAFSLVLLVGAALMIRTLANLQAVEPGYQPEGLVAVNVSLPTDKYPTPAARIAFFETLTDKLLGTSGITDVALAWGVPPSGGGFSAGKPQVEGGTPLGQALLIPFNTITPEYFRTLRIPIVAGRTFANGDTEEHVIVSRALAERLWAGGNAVGRRFRMNERDQWKTVVGIAGNVESLAAGDQRTTLHFYYPWAPPTATASSGTVSLPPSGAPRRRSYDARTFIVRASDPAGAIPIIKDAIWSMDRNQPVARAGLVTDLYAESFGRQRFVLLLMTAFAIVALVLTAAGVFAVLSQVVAQRTREIGIRVALGARPVDVLSLIMSRGMVLTAMGTVLGLGGAYSLTRFLQALLFEVQPHDPFSFAAVSLLLLTVGAAACWLPTRAAMRVEPAEALRIE